MRWKVGAPIVACILAAGCSTLTPAPGDSEVVQSWSGRFALTVNAPGSAEQRTTGSFSLTESKTVTLLELSTPLGVTIASARVSATAAILVTADGKRYDAASGEDLTEQLFGWRIPVQRLPAWLAARPARVVEFLPGETLNGSDRLPLLGEENGWSIRYEVWNERKLARILISFPDRVSLRMVLNGS